MPKTQIPDRGYCIAASHSGYEECFPAGKKGQALRAARRLANRLRKPVDIVKVSNHGNDRHIVGEVLPKGW